MSKLGIIAGRGHLPRDLVDHCIAIGRPFFVLGLETFANPSDYQDVEFSETGLVQVNKGLSHLRKAEVTDVVFVGKVERPSLKALRPDLKAAAFLAKLGKGFLGDNSLMGAVKTAIEEEGFHVLGVDEVFSDAVAKKGVWGQISPSEAALQSAESGKRLAKGIGALDIGQAVVMQGDLCLAVEAIEGTDALINRSQTLGDKTLEAPVLVKGRKPQQDRRLDLPTVGPDTVKAAAASGFAGIAVEAGETLVVALDEMISVADEAGMFLIGLDANESG